MKLNFIQFILLTTSPVLAAIAYYGGGFLYFTYKVWYRKKIIIVMLKQLKPGITDKEIKSFFTQILQK